MIPACEIEREELLAFPFAFYLVDSRTGCARASYEDLGGGAGQVVAAEAEVDELAERDDDGGLEDDKEQRVQRHVLQGAAASHAAGRLLRSIAGRSEKRRMPIDTGCERDGGWIKALSGRAPAAGECEEGTAAWFHGMAKVGVAALGE
jgi:hypothetical protein